MTTGPEWGGRLGTQQRFADVRIATDLSQLIQWRELILRGSSGTFTPNAVSNLTRVASRRFGVTQDFWCRSGHRRLRRFTVESAAGCRDLTPRGETRRAR